VESRPTIIKTDQRSIHSNHISPIGLIAADFLIAGFPNTGYALRGATGSASLEYATSEENSSRKCNSSKPQSVSVLQSVLWGAKGEQRERESVDYLLWATIPATSAEAATISRINSTAAAYCFRLTFLVLRIPTKRN
jgi:hypothetical protein